MPNSQLDNCLVNIIDHINTTNWGHEYTDIVFHTPLYMLNSELHSFLTWYTITPSKWAQKFTGLFLTWFCMPNSQLDSCLIITIWYYYIIKNKWGHICTDIVFHVPLCILHSQLDSFLVNMINHINTTKWGHKYTTLIKCSSYSTLRTKLELDSYFFNMIDNINTTK